MATQFFSDEQMERLRSYPDIGREELIRFFTLTRKDLGFVDKPGAWRRARACGAIGLFHQAAEFWSACTWYAPVW